MMLRNFSWITFCMLMALSLPNLAFASQFQDYNLGKLECTSNFSPIIIEDQQINRHYKISMIGFTLKKKKYTLSSLGSILHNKCLFYFYAFNPQTELYEMRLSYRNKTLNGNLYYQKGQESWSSKVSCPLNAEQMKLLPPRCLPAKPPKKKASKEPQRIYQLTPPKNYNETGAEAGSSAETE